MTQKEKNKQMEAAAERQRKCRAARKLNNSINCSSLNTSTITSSEESPYRIPKTLGKAVKKNLEYLTNLTSKASGCCEQSSEKGGFETTKGERDQCL